MRRVRKFMCMFLILRAVALDNVCDARFAVVLCPERSMDALW